MKLVNSAQMQELDRRTIEEFGTPGEVLMDRAGYGIAEHVRRLAAYAGLSRPLIQLIAGRGNNGGDVFVAARYLRDHDFEVDVLLSGSTGDIRGDARTHLRLMREMDIPLVELPTPDDWEEARVNDRGEAEILVDGILGTGAKGPARGPAAAAIDYMNAVSPHAYIVSVDIPSGLNADTGTAEGSVVRADMTVTMGLPKIGLALSDGVEYSGVVEVVDIGIPPEYADELETECELISGAELSSIFPRRRRTSHKGDYGHVLLIGGARGYSGAIALAAQAALRSGCGLVTVLTPESIAHLIASYAAEIMVRGVAETEAGSISAAGWTAWENRINDFDALLIGPGMTQHKDTVQIIHQITRASRKPLVMDADALNVLKGQPHWLEKADCPVIITPHPGEFARLTSQTTADVQADRIGKTREFAQATNAIVVLKGAGTVIAHPGRPAQINMTGNPGMATGGTGDVLAGLLTSLLGQRLDPFDAARAAVYLHGKAADTLAWNKTQAGFTAGDITEQLPGVLQEILFR